MAMMLQEEERKGVIERWLDKRNKTFNVVVAKSFNYFYNEEVYLVIHVGKFTKKKGLVK